LNEHVSRAALDRILITVRDNFPTGRPRKRWSDSHSGNNNLKRIINKKMPLFRGTHVVVTVLCRLHNVGTLSLTSNTAHVLSV
jgi:hypothetical protein